LAKAREKVAEAKKEQQEAKAEAKAAEQPKPKDQNGQPEAKPDQAQAAKEDPAKAEAAAQEKVTEAAHDAADMAQAAAPDAASTLQDAAQKSDQARQQAAQHNAKDAAQSQEKTAEALDKADQQLKEAIDKLAPQETQQMAQEHQESGKLAEQAVPVDPAANAALRQAESQAAPTPPPQEAQGKQEEVRQSLGDAAAALAAREQQIAAETAQAMAQAEGQGDEPPGMEEAGQEEQPGQGPHGKPVPGHASPVATGGGSMHPGQKTQPNQAMQVPVTNEPPKPQANAPGGTPTPDANAGGKKFLEEPWFARLPPEVRNAIRNNAQRQPPRGYEERLQRYFENLD
jgi:hypothetical protein